MAGESDHSRISEYKKRVRTLDFVTRSEDRVFVHQESIRTGSISEIFKGYHGIFDEGQTYARHSSELVSGTWASSLEIKIRRALNDRYPVVVEPQRPEDPRHEPPCLVLMVRDAKKEHFQYVPDDGSYRFVSHGHVLQVSEKERDFILNLPPVFLEPDEQDLQRERQSIELVIRHTKLLTEDMQKGQLLHYLEGLTYQ
jgi:hypothetical protein